MNSSEIDLANFFDDLDPKIESRGWDLYENGAVSALVQLDSLNWRASVQGTYSYSTWVSLSDEGVNGHACECPYDWGPVCKHIVATVLALQDEISKPGEDPAPLEDVLSAKEEVELLAKGIKRKELLDFIVSECASNAALLDAFRFRFGADSKKISLPDGSAMIDKAIQLAVKHGNRNFIAESYLEEVLQELHHWTEKFFQEKNWALVFGICSAILHKIPQYIGRILVDNEGVRMDVVAAIETIGKLLPGLERGPELSLWVDEMILLLSKKDIRAWGFDAYLWDVLSAAELETAQQAALLGQVEQVMQDVLRKDSDWELVAWIQRKQSLLLAMGRAEDALALLQSYLYLPEIRMLLVEAEIQADNSHKAKALVREGMQLENQKGLAARPLPWREQLLRIAMLESDAMDIRVHAKVLFLDGGGDMKHYQILKSTYTPAEWKVQVEQLIAQLNPLNSLEHVKDEDRLAQILVQEQYFDRLLELLQANPHRFKLIKKYSPFLKSQYPAEILDLYKDAIKAYVPYHTGRSAYKVLVNMLRALEQLDDGIAAREEMVGLIRDLFNRRSAMLDILDEAF